MVAAVTIAATYLLKVGVNIYILFIQLLKIVLSDCDHRSSTRKKFDAISLALFPGQQVFIFESLGR